MRTSTVHEIKQELASLKPAELINLCLRLARFKKENKELLTYLLFEAGDEESYIKSIKQEVEELFTTVNLTQLYLAKKTLRKILRVINKHARISGNKQTDIELRIFFCQQLHASGIPFRRSAALGNLYDGQLKKIKAVLVTLHEDLQHDYSKEIANLEEEDSDTGKKSWSLFGSRKKSR